MTDRQVFEKFMKWIGMSTIKAKEIDGQDVVTYNNNNNPRTNDPRFTTIGYDEFYAGAIFDKEGTIIKGALDSHVAYMSDNLKEIEKMIDQFPTQELQHPAVELTEAGKKALIRVNKWKKK